MTKTTQERRTINIFGNWRVGGPDSEFAGNGVVMAFAEVSEKPAEK